MAIKHALKSRKTHKNCRFFSALHYNICFFNQKLIAPMSLVSELCEFWKVALIWICWGQKILINPEEERHSDSIRCLWTQKTTTFVSKGWGNTLERSVPYFHEISQRCHLVISRDFVLNFQRLIGCLCPAIREQSLFKKKKKKNDNSYQEAGNIFDLRKHLFLHFGRGGKQALCCWQQLTQQAALGMQQSYTAKTCVCCLWWTSSMFADSIYWDPHPNVARVT